MHVESRSKYNNVIKNKNAFKGICRQFLETPFYKQ